MFNPDMNAVARPRVQEASFRANWEFDVRDISVESCHINEDPLGFRVVFFKLASNDCYSVGASHLSTRLKKLSRAGFDAPMTEKALNIIDQKRLKVLQKVL